MMFPAALARYVKYVPKAVSRNPKTVRKSPVRTLILAAFILFRFSISVNRSIYMVQIS